MNKLLVKLDETLSPNHIESLCLNSFERLQLRIKLRESWTYFYSVEDEIGSRVIKR